MYKQLFNVGLRVTSLAAKLLLTLYMGRYLGMEDLGVYGLVLATVSVMAGALGLRLDYAVSRDLVGASGRATICMLRDQIAFLGVSYAFFAFVILICLITGVAETKMLLFVFVLSSLESFSGSMGGNFISMGAPLFSTLLFFVRAGAWCFFAVLLGVIWPVFRTVDVVLWLWALGEFLAVCLNGWAWRKLPWKEVAQIPVNWRWVWDGIKVCFPMWVGTLGTMLALSVDRFVVSYYLDLEEVGVITFYSSFAIALLSLVQSGFFAFSYPHLIDYYRKGDHKAFWAETWRTGWQVALFVLAAALVIGFVIPWAAPLFGKPRLASESLTLWLLLGGIWIRANADTLYYVLYARNQDRALWLSSILFLIPALVGNLLFVPWLGLPGAGISSIVACLFLLLHRLWYVFRPA
ncbi:MAG: lipopolysaccharide biosynthesis protein [Bdellovibrionales bacterium]